ncbi:epoxide hydrolase [Talaromyces proteolyticus]|uniref:Epoxide hydrolase n=1 Tax=Talaromyces proteolyticus TaxID=1131652 RepID=A0AAD4KYF5_9EURO|nr:epoxide hydrolase [Talaromyces proteolyticus]KAH8703855.1 epoxide hydrolase [Talaromyces proteolyticus]
MDRFQQKQLVTRRSLKYTYFVSPSGDSTEKNPALIFLHGFPDSAHLWSEVVAMMEGLPNKIIIPDCLGYAGTDKPEDISLYSYDGQADDLEDILQNENAKVNVIIGHDWGSVLAQRTYLHKSHLFSGIILLNTGYMVPSTQPFDLAVVNRTTEKVLGYPQFAYWEFFLSHDAAEIIDGNLERMWQALHGDVENWMQKLFCVPDAMREFILGDEEVSLKAYAKKLEWKDRFIRQFKTDGFASSLQMYKATAWNVQSKSDSTIPSENLAIRVPMLFIICTQDAVCVPDIMTPAKEQGLVPMLKEVVIESAHWSPMEKPGEIALHIVNFLSNTILSH